MIEKPKKKLSPEDRKFYDHRAKWVEAMFRADFGHAEFRVLYFIAQRSNHEKRGSHWSVSRIAEECRCSTRTVSDATMEADRQGYLKVHRTLGHENFYELLFFWLGVTQ